MSLGVLVFVDRLSRRLVPWGLLVSRWLAPCLFLRGFGLYFLVHVPLAGVVGGGVDSDLDVLLGLAPDVHDLNLHEDPLAGVVVAGDVLEAVALEEAPLDGPEADDADEHPQGVVEDVGHEVPEALI